MILGAHIFIALASVAYTTYLFFAPSQSRLNVSYGLTAATLLSGTYLVVSRGTHILESCVLGLLYIGAVSVVIASARRELAVYKVKDRKKLL
jgi:hypothetical protein